VEDSLEALYGLFQSPDVDPGARGGHRHRGPYSEEGGFSTRRRSNSCASCGVCCDPSTESLLIVDEIQTGFGRDRQDVRGRSTPVLSRTLMTIAKSVSGGIPLSAVIGKADIMDSPLPGGLGRHVLPDRPLACAAGLAVLNVIKEEQLLQRSQSHWQVHDIAPERFCRSGFRASVKCAGGRGDGRDPELVKNCSADQPGCRVDPAVGTGCRPAKD